MNGVLTKCEQSVNMKNGDGLSDAVSAVCVVAAPEEGRQIRPDVCLCSSLCCSSALWPVLFFSLYVSREYPYHRAHAHAHDPPGYQGHRRPAPRYILFPHTRF